MKTFLSVKRKFIQRKPKGYKSEKYWAHFNFPIPYVCAALDISIQWWNWPPEVLILLLCSKPPHNFKLLIPRHFTLLSKQIREAKLSFAHRPRKQQQYRVPQKNFLSWFYSSLTIISVQSVGYLKLFWIKKGNQKCAQKNTLALKWTWDQLFSLIVLIRNAERKHFFWYGMPDRGLQGWRFSSNSPPIFTN